MADRPSVQPSLYRRGARFYANIRRLDKSWRNYNTGETDRNRAQTVAEAMQIRADKGLPPVEKKDGQAQAPAALLTVRQLAARFLLEYHRHSIKDLDTYRMKAGYDFAYLLYPYLGDAVASTLRRGDVKAYLQRLRDEKDYGPGTLRVALARLSIVYSWAIDDEVLVDMVNPCQGIRLAKAAPSEEHYTLEQIGRLLALPDVPVMLVCALYTGMRVGELRALKWEWVDLEGRVLDVRASYEGLPKNGRPRQIPIHRELLPWLKRHRASGQTDLAGLVFPEPHLNGAGQRIGWRMAWPDENDLLQEVMKRADAPVYGRPWKACRHSLGTHLAKATHGNLDVVSKILGNGHGSHVASVTMGYVHTADLDYIASELDKLSYQPAAKAGKGQGAKVLSFAEEQEKRGRAAARTRKTATEQEASSKGPLAPGLHPRSSNKDGAA
jgi:integrase